MSEETTDIDEKLLAAIYLLIECIEARGLEHEGIYRVSGSYTASKNLKAAMVKHDITKPEELKAMVDATDSVHELTATFKQILRAMKPPLLTYAHYDAFKTAVHQSDLNERNMALGEALKLLPVDRLQVIKQLIAHLRKVAALQQTNKMTEENLALMFGPTIMRSPDGIMTDLQDTGTQATVVRELLTAPEGAAGGAIDMVLRGGGGAGNISAAAASMSPRQMVYPKRANPVVVEAMEAMVETQSSLSTDQLSNDDAFNLFDIDGDGEISLEELGTILRAQGNLMVEADIKAVMRAIDTNGDGVIDREEWALASSHNLMKAALTGETVPKPHENKGACLQLLSEFDRIDRGNITKEELIVLCETYGGGEMLELEEMEELLDALGLSKAPPSARFDYKQFVGMVAPTLIGSTSMLQEAANPDGD